MNFPRPIYLERIRPFIGSGLIKVLMGQRRVGKSYILNQLIAEIKSSKPDADIIYINKEEYAFDSIRTYHDLLAYLKERGGKKPLTYLFLDEVQDIDKFEIALRSLLAEGCWEIFCTGSNATLLSGELATHLGGRTVQIRIHTLSYAEYLDFYKIDDSAEVFLGYLKTGGMPHLVNLVDDEAVIREYHKNVLDSIVLRDIVARYGIRNVNFLNDLLRFLADSVGSLVSAKRISDYLKSQRINLNPKLVLDYLGYIESVFFVDRVSRIDIQGRKIFEIGIKYYFEDLGMRNVLIPFQIGSINKLLENVVYHHLKVHNYQVYVGKLNGTEIDFVAERDGERIYVQVAYLISDDKTHQREFGNLLAVPDNSPKYVVSMDEPASGNYKGIKHVSIRNFLLNPKL